MLDTMYANHGIGLAAVQVGVLKRIIVVDIDWPSPRYEDEGGEPEEATPNPIVMINPEITRKSTQMKPYKEGCLSFPDQYSDVERPAEVTISYTDLDGKAQTLEADDLLAVCVQHEIDHINGIVFTDHISKLKREMIVKKLVKMKKLGTLPAVEQKEAAPR
jgi:peptide deformylase